MEDQVYYLPRHCRCYGKPVGLTLSQIAAMLSLRASPSVVYHFIMQPKPRTSTCVTSIDVSPLTGTAIVEFHTGTRYEYNNVSRRAITNLLAQPNMSLGFWVNANCKAKGVKCREITPASFYKHKLAKVRLVQEPVLPLSLIHI